MSGKKERKSQPAPVSPTDALEQAMLVYVREGQEGVALITGWAIVAEIMSTDGVPDVVAFAADGMPYWRINGLLDAAPEAMHYDFDYEDDE